MDTRNSEQIPSIPSIASYNALWMVPYARNLYFSGRAGELQEIAATLKAGTNGTNGLAIVGAGGMGKTQLALEYAYHAREEYRYVFWVLAESRDTLNFAYNDIAELLDLPGKEQQAQHLVIEAVKSWLARNTGWLLILDQVNDLALVKNFLPEAFPGHLLLTTRTSTTGKLAQRIKLKKLDTAESICLLLRRAGILTAEAPLAEALPEYVDVTRAIVEELNGLPLALDLAGAYLVETSCSLSNYLDLLRRVKSKQTRKRGEQLEDQPGSVAKTVHLAYEKITKANSLAAALLNFCAFLAPEEIPETLIAASAPVLPRPLQKPITNPAKLNATLGLLQRYALVTRDPAISSLVLQREVQTAVREMLPGSEERAWAERAVRGIGLIFSSLLVDDWETCQRLLPHTQACLTLLDHWQMEVVEGAWMLHQAAWYLHTRGEYAAAQSYEERALAIYRAVCGDEHPSTAMILNNLAITYEDRGNLKDAAALHQQALAIRRSTLGENHLETAASMSNLAFNYHTQNRLEDAASLYRQALAIRCELLGDRHPDTAATIDNLALVYRDLGRFDDALSLCQQALSTRRKVLGDRHPDTIATIGNIAAIYHEMGKFDEAIHWLRQALVLQRKTQSYESLEAAATLNQLAAVYQEQGQLDEATFWLQQALAMQRTKLAHEQPDLANSLEELALAYERQEQPDKAEALYHQALAIYLATCGEDHPDTAHCLYNLALLYQDQKRTGEARSLFARAQAIWQVQHGPKHPDTRKAREKYEQLLENGKDTPARHENRRQDEQNQDGAAHPRGIARVIRRVGGKR